jgi:hypothetical protein
VTAPLVLVSTYTAASPDLREAIDRLRFELARVDTKLDAADRQARRRDRQILRRAAERLAEALGEEMPR